MSTLTDTLSALLAGPAETTEHPTLSTVRPDVLTHTREAYTALYDTPQELPGATLPRVKKGSVELQESAR